MMTLTHDSIEEYLDALTVNGSSTNTRQAYRQHLSQLMKAMSPKSEISEYDVASFLTENRGRYSASTVRVKLACFRSYARHHGIEGFLGSYRTPSPPRGVAHPVDGGMETVHDMIRTTKNDKHKALIALMGYCGLRLSEALAVKVEDIIQSPGNKYAIAVRHGKGDKERIVQTHAYVVEEILVPAAAQNPDPLGPICKMAPRVARTAIYRAGNRLGIKCSPHDLRHTFGTEAWRRSHNIRAVQDLLGHVDQRTTQVYTGVSEAEQRQATDFFDGIDSEEDAA